MPRAKLKYLPAQAFAGVEGQRGGGVIQEGFGIFQLLMLVGEHFQADLLDKKQMQSAEAEAYCFYDTQTARIEVLKDGRLERVYFTIPPVCAYLSETTRADVVWTIPRTDPATKVVHVRIRLCLFLGLGPRPYVAFAAALINIY